MYIGNVGIFVKDLKGARRFFESYFGARLLKSYNEPENNYYSDILELDHGAWLELMTKPEIRKVDEAFAQGKFIVVQTAPAVRPGPRLLQG